MKIILISGVVSSTDIAIKGGKKFQVLSSKVSNNNALIHVEL